MDPVEIVVGRGGQSDRVLIEVRGRMHPGSTDFWDGNWLTSPVRARVGGFAARINAGLRIDELRDFRVALERVYTEVQGSATLSSMENWIELTIECHPTGSLSVLGTLGDDPGMGNILHFMIKDLDQTDLPPIVDALIAVEERFPVVGRA
ncbi:hypothetical protein HD597_009352 [Nonomuraea thailandensis]|uniref:Uncharacterized protein n=1 Tax=Nonomuraea thailandensis TaxID=1188745 RepID=A0A9X2K690_9ACTN|nr:hypothetical protein [Nonomuraea thailandensis]MCP2362332.1 hypothetical protein [Nonomuraea thailandensis]